ncbi:hypothetical protein FA13DRAFT_691820 [Coprinellus micaceus]|uniref:Chromo shadow domain-containing protein n=1 Tax=Coprinellus micaceus TaxID=71717 RepID=A0A4Y7T4N1_COPMI|nr:hypothetical protein FA13DRAFT_691820 [Coprinellus micaceus]
MTLEDLVAEFWKTHPKKGQQLSSAKKKGRQSSAAESVSAAGTKRGRKSIAKEESDDDVDETPSTTRASKKAKRGANNAKSASAARSVSPEIGTNLQTMPDNYSHLEVWDPVVKVVDTVERDGEDLYVYFTLHDGRQVKEANATARLRLPQKLLDFYESNLRWRAAED